MRKKTRHNILIADSSNSGKQRKRLMQMCDFSMCRLSMWRKWKKVNNNNEQNNNKKKYSNKKIKLKPSVERVERGRIMEKHLIHITRERKNYFKLKKNRQFITSFVCESTTMFWNDCRKTSTNLPKTLTLAQLKRKKTKEISCSHVLALALKVTKKNHSTHILAFVEKMLSIYQRYLLLLVFLFLIFRFGP